MAMEPLPLGFGDAMDTTLFSTLWSFQEELQPQESVEELKQSLLAATMELEVSKEELRRKEQSIAKLADLVRQVAKERDDARDQVQQLLLAAAKQAAPPVHQPAPALGTSSVTDSDCSLVSSPVDPFFDPVTSSDRRRCGGGKLGAASPPPPAKQQQLCGADAVLDMLAAKKPLPPRGRLLQSVMEAGPLLQNLLVAGPLPRWRNPPPVHALDTLPVGGGGVYMNATPLHAANAGAAPGYGPNANSACMKRPIAAMPAMPMAATSCSPSRGFAPKRHRLH
ncbi:uncharacterized protein LOC119360675 isoform X1 [Triticum dicoccoides]|uniref:uncharacterized protein LOC119360675 isoform X1 n=1 Tax=Triticum dicoccoides TaxID=85692 RepID=UPI00188F0E2E|nr:uncharacterized protein LOC119360675 isoform X1 [Triticum dicoccoides]